MARKLARGPSAPDPTQAHSVVIRWPPLNIAATHIKSLIGGTRMAMARKLAHGPAPPDHS
jgi:hypothetical protein